MNSSLRILAVFALLGLAALLIASSPAAATSVSLQGYDSGGGFVPVGDGGSIPVGAILKVRVWADLYSCDPMRVNWGDGTTQTRNYGGSFSGDWYHTYDVAGTYTITASDCQGATDVATISVGGGGLALFDPSSDLFIPTFLGLIFGVIGLAAANATPGTQARSRMANPVGSAPAPPPRPRLKPGIPVSMTQHIVSLRDIPDGALRQEPPTIAMRPGEPTDVLQRVTCSCGAPLGYTAAGWFCTSPTCPLRQPGNATTQFPNVGEPRASQLLR